MERMPDNYPARTQKLRPDQIAAQQTWGVVPDTDMTKAAAHEINVVPAGSTTITVMNEMDPGITSETVGEGRGWKKPPRAYGHNAVAGRGMR